ncbi:cytochrome P450 [Streptomyces boncukensis]|uniref:Cytochrome P450 n=1 Tax=Streptomyces boncukensis TaxID=2711219 RepID=A0A6G4WSS2_9ACTN|nr:cytochrome P450 [Streptomyces boncukensis]NGO68316.1 cytochrome P450 [Streptomyces boncukensis]
MRPGERALRAQLAFFRDFIRNQAEQGDPYANVLGVPENPYPHYEEVRARGRLYRSSIGSWVTADHKLANEILRDRRLGVRKANGEKLPEIMSFDNSLLGADPPDHTRLRRVMTPTLNPRMAGGWRPRVKEICSRLIDDILAEDKPFNLMTAFAQQLPVAVIADLVGIPERCRADFFHISRRITPLLEGVVTYEQTQSTEAAIKEMTDLFVDIIALRKADPQDDMISRLVPLVDEGTLSMDELVPMVTFVPLAGSETTVNLVGNGILALLAHPEQWQLLVERPELAAGVAEETLRYDPPVQQYRRIAHERIELAGHTLPVDGELAIMVGGANRDPQVFPDPGTFDITRDIGADTLAFSAGIHYCMGASLAKLEAEVAFEALTARIPRLRRAGPIRRSGSFIIRGMREFPVAAR